MNDETDNRPGRVGLSPCQSVLFRNAWTTALATGTLKRASQWALLLLILFAASPTVFAQDPPAEAPAPAEAPVAAATPVVNITDKWTVLVNPGRPRPQVIEFTDKSPLQNVKEFKLLGPSVGHPFCLGEFIVDGRWATAKGTVQVVEGTNTLLSLATADQFEMEGIIHQEGSGGWLMLLGWNQGHGYSLSNVSLIKSGAPWFLCEYRNAEAIALTNNEVKQFNWDGEQAFRMTVKDKLLTVMVGKTAIVEEYPLENYTAGQIFLGTYNTRYGARPVKVKSLRIRALVDKPEKSEKPKKADPPAKPGVLKPKPAKPGEAKPKPVTP